LMLLEPPGEEAGNFKPIASSFSCSHGFKINWIGDSSLAGCANLLAGRANCAFRKRLLLRLEQRVR
jgi:hypothetical protein